MTDNHDSVEGRHKGRTNGTTRRSLLRTFTAGALASAGLGGARSVEAAEPPDQPPGAVTFFDDFEDGTFDGWGVLHLPENPGGPRNILNDWSVTDDDPISGDRSLFLHSVSDHNAIVTDDRVVDMSEDFELSFEWQTPDPQNRGPILQLVGVDGNVFNRSTGFPIGSDWADHIFGDNTIQTSFDADQIGLPGHGGFSGQRFTRDGFATHTPHTIRIVKEGASATLFVNGTKFAESDVITTGQFRIALISSGFFGTESFIKFDDVTVRKLARPRIDVGDVRMVQTVEESVVSDESGGDAQIPTPDYVAGRNATPVFDLTVRDLGDGSLPRDIPMRIVYDGIDREPDELVLDRVLLDLFADGGLPLADFENVAQSADDYPIFELSDDLDGISVEIADSLDDIDGDSTTSSFPPADRSVATVPRLDIGVVAVENDVLFDGIDDYAASVERMAASFEELYPVADVAVYRHPGDDPVLASGLADVDSWRARNALDRSLPVSTEESPGEVLTVDEGSVTVGAGLSIETFDFTIGMVPSDLLEAEGRHVTWEIKDESGDPVSQPPKAALVKATASPETGPHEGGHHFAGEPYDGVLGAEGGDDHASTDLRSTVADVTDGSSINIRSEVESFMTPTTSPAPGTDAVVYQKMIDGQFDPVPPEGTLTDEEVWRVLFEDTDDGGPTVRESELTSGGVVTDVSGSAATVGVVDSDGTELVSQQVPIGVESATSDGSGTDNPDVGVAHVELPENSFEVTVDTPSGATTVNPLYRSLVDALDRLPDAAFGRHASKRRHALDQKLAAVNRQMQRGAFQAAARKTDRDVKDKFDKWLVEDADSGAAQHSKTELLELATEVVERLRVLADSRGAGRGR